MTACQNRCKDASQFALDVLRKLILERGKNGSLAVDELLRMIDLVGGGAVILDQAYLVHEQRCVNEKTKRSAPVGARENPLHRLLVRPFEFLLNDGSFDRSHLGAFFIAVKELIGPDYAQFDQDARHLIRGLLAVHGQTLTWIDLYQHPKVVELMLVTQTHIHHCLNQPDRLARFRHTLKHSNPHGERLSPLEIDELITVLQTSAQGLKKIHESSRQPAS